MDVTAARGTGTSSSARLWFALLGGMAAYALHLVVGFWVVPAACGAGFEHAVPWLVSAATLVAAGVAVAATAVAVRARRDCARDRPEQEQPEPTGTAPLPPAWDDAPASSTAHFMASAGVLLSALALLVIVVAGLPPLLVPPCA